MAGLRSLSTEHQTTVWRVDNPHHEGILGPLSPGRSIQQLPHPVSQHGLGERLSHELGIGLESAARDDGVIGVADLLKSRRLIFRQSFYRKSPSTFLWPRPDSPFPIAGRDCIVSRV